MLVVLDVNILISALIAPTGVAGRVVQAGLDEAFEIAVCPMRMAEFTRAAVYPKVAAVVAAGESDRLHAAIETAARSEPDPASRALSRDPKDDYLIALAIAAHADHLVTGDRDLLDLEDPPVTITSLRSFAKLLGL